MLELHGHVQEPSCKNIWKMIHTIFFSVLEWLSLWESHGNLCKTLTWQKWVILCYITNYVMGVWLVAKYGLKGLFLLPQNEECVRQWKDQLQCESITWITWCPGICCPTVVHTVRHLNLATDNTKLNVGQILFHSSLQKSLTIAIRKGMFNHCNYWTNDSPHFFDTQIIWNQLH